MKITKSQLRKIIKEEFNSEADSIARDQAGQIGQENYDILDKVGDALVKGGDATNWVLDNDEWQSLIVPTSDADMPEFIEAIETVLSNNLGMSIKQLLGLKENKMKITKSQLRKIIKEETARHMAEATEGDDNQKQGWPPDPPKGVPVTQGSGPTPEQVVQIFKKLASMNPPQDAEKELAQMGGPEALAKNYELLRGQFANSSKNPDRIKMPVVDPVKDLKDLENRIAKGALDLKPPYADLDLDGHKSKESGAANRKDKVTLRKNEALIKKIAQLIIERKQSIREQGEIDQVHPQGLNKMPKQVRAAYLTKGLKDGDKADDSAVTMKPAVITVGEALPTQSQVYIDKSLWNVLNYSGTAPGEKAFAKKNDIIAIESEGKAYILDGHHRWSAAMLSGGPTATLDVNLIRGLEISPAIAALRSYGNARGNKQKG